MLRQQSLLAPEIRGGFAVRLGYSPTRPAKYSRVMSPTKSSFGMDQLWMEMRRLASRSFWLKCDAMATTADPRAWPLFNLVSTVTSVTCMPVGGMSMGCPVHRMNLLDRRISLCKDAKKR